MRQLFLEILLHEPWRMIAFLQVSFIPERIKWKMSRQSKIFTMDIIENHFSLFFKLLLLYLFLIIIGRLWLMLKCCCWTKLQCFVYTTFGELVGALSPSKLFLVEFTCYLKNFCLRTMRLKLHGVFR